MNKNLSPFVQQWYNPSSFTLSHQLMRETSLQKLESFDSSDLRNDRVKVAWLLESIFDKVSKDNILTLIDFIPILVLSTIFFFDVFKLNNVLTINLLSFITN